MMSESHQDAIQGLFVFIAVLILALMMPFILKAFKSKKSLPSSEESLDQDSSKHPYTPFSNIEVIKDHKEAAPAVSTKTSNPLGKTEAQIFGRIRNLFGSSQSTPQIEQIEEILYTSDLGPTTVEQMMGSIQAQLSGSQKKDFSSIQDVIVKEMSRVFDLIPTSPLVKWAPTGPTVIMVVGVNGAGKTTTIGKLSALWAAEGKKVLVAAGDTFRAAAGSQLKVWTDRAQVEIFSPENVTDPSAVSFAALEAAKSRGYDVVLLDTAGRLPNQAHLMEELKKVKRVMMKVIPEAPHETWIVLDANSGQNAKIQAEQFHQALNLSGVVLTKLDGTSKGGVAVSIVNDLRIPIKWIGLGEKIQDLKIFSAQDFVNSLTHQGSL